MVPGVEIQLGSEKYTLPPLPLIHMGSIRKLLAGGSTLEDDDYVNSLVNALHLSLQRNYPEVQREVVAANLDMVNYKHCLTAFMEANNLTPKGEASGENPAS
jgi:hypothetical protein